ncbi:MAG: spondin domain-containing protein [Ilumatobacter sp.]|uniref:spondin domain-containing protein n=1 Tax=Ilumatobacter sp. TaxID=1967498 RepID=UPI002611BAD7|nr:spondin domain-containing protein [Ilumatobacter sp.]MDJ0771596.1 spondin domain-containing protein [Ilumatobacter sp.]
MKTSRHTLRRSLAVTVALGGLAAVPSVADAGRGGANATYQVTIENISTGFQPFSPAGAVVHSRRVDVWNTGSPATAAVAAIAEDANLGVFVDTYDQVPGVRDAFVGGDAPFGPGGVSTFTFDARRGDRLSLVNMLVNTNDAFTGLDSVRLGNRTQVFEVRAYDAGTEANNELASHIPGPVGGNPFVREPEGGVIAPHPGVEGIADLDPAVHGWEGPVARITIERIDDDSSSDDDDSSDD